MQRLVGERLGRLLLGGDVLDLGDEVQRLVVVVAHEPRRHRRPDDVPVGVQVALLGVRPVAAAGEHPLEHRPAVGEVVRVGELRPAEQLQLLARAAEHVAERGVDALEAAVGVVTTIPIIASSKLERKRSSLSRAVASAASLLARTRSFSRHETIEARPAASTKPAWMPAHFHGCAIASGWLKTACLPIALPTPWWSTT